jgi:hypothetical protein
VTPPLGWPAKKALPMTEEQRRQLREWEAANLPPLPTWRYKGPTPLTDEQKRQIEESLRATRLLQKQAENTTRIKEESKEQTEILGKILTELRKVGTST